MVNHSRRKTVIIFILFSIGIIVPFSYALLKEFYFYQAVVAGLLLLPILAIPLVRYPRKTILFLFVISVSINPSFPLVQNNLFRYPLHLNLWLSDLMLLVCWLYIFFRKLNYRSKISHIIHRHSRVLLLFFLLWITFGLVSLFFAADKEIVLIELARMVRVFLVYLTLPFLIQSKSDLPFLAMCLVGSVFLQAVLVIAQYISGGQLLRIPGGSRDLDLVAVGTLFRPAGTLGHSSNYAKISALVLPVSLVLQQYLTRPWLRKFFALVTVTLFIATVIVVSRIGLATSILGVSLVLFMSLRTARGKRIFLLTLTVCFIGLGAAWFAGGQRIVDRFVYDFNSAGLRIPMFKTAVAMIQEHPEGVGLNNYVLVAPAYDYDGIMSFFPFPVHNIYLLNFAELGLLGGLSLIGLIAVPIILAFKAAGRARDDFHKALLQAMGIGIGCCWLQGLTDWGHRASVIHFLYFAFLAAIISSYDIFKESESAGSLDQRFA